MIVPVEGPVPIVPAEAMNQNEESGAPDGIFPKGHGNRQRIAGGRQMVAHEAVQSRQQGFAFVGGSGPGLKRGKGRMIRASEASIKRAEE